MSTVSLHDRVSFLEEEVARLKRRLDAQAETPRQDRIGERLWERLPTILSTKKLCDSGGHTAGRSALAPKPKRKGRPKRDEVNMVVLDQLH